MKKNAKPTLVQTNRKLAREWHPTKNAPLTPKDVTPGCSRKVWWKCDKGHQWETSVHHRSSRGDNCPYCSGQRVCEDNCLRTVNLKLAREWHPTLNVPLTPGDVRPGSSIKVWWLCGKGHEWETSIADRSHGTGCPYCAGTRPSKDNNLQTLNPTMAREWHPIKNAPLTPKDVTRSCNKKIWWVCGKGHEYEASLNNRSRGVGCPYCVGKKVGKDNSLLTVNPLIAKDWHPNRNFPLTPKDVTAHSSKKIWWLCKKGHEWRVAVNDRKSCPFCSGRYATKENCLQTANPVVAREWHPTKNAPLTPKDVLPKSNKKAWWICRKGHEWEAPPDHRMRGCGCPYCSGKRVTKENCLLTVKPRLAREWHQTKNASLTPRTVTAFAGRQVWWMCGKGHEWKAQINNRSNGRGCPYCAGKKAGKDNCLSTVSTAIAREWHPSKNAPSTPSEVTAGSGKKAWWLCENGHEWQALIGSRTRGRGCPYCAGLRATGESCLETVNRRLAREWHTAKNAPLTPKDVTSKSAKKTWWVCGKGHEWRAVIASRTAGNGCPYCAGKKADKDTCLQTVFPMLAKEWHLTKNGSLTSKDVMPGSDRKVWWTCRKGHEWAASLSHRTAGSGCPFCSGKRPGIEDCLETKGPWLAREWHPTKNASWSPKDVAPYSQRQVWWKCKKGHEARESVCSRVQRGGCLECVLKRKEPQLFERETCKT